MSYGRLKAKEAELSGEIDELMLFKRRTLTEEDYNMGSCLKKIKAQEKRWTALNDYDFLSLPDDDEERLSIRCFT